MELAMIKLSIRPSSAARWLNCPGNPRIQTLANKLPPEEEADYAAGGTAAHAWLEFYLGGTDGPPTDNDGKVTEIPEEDKKLLGGVADHIMWYADTCGYQIETEREYKITFDLQSGRPVEIYGHIDVLLSNDDSLVVLDYKHGAGKHVSVVDNPQTLLYLLAAIEGRAAEGKPSTSNHAMGIIQPRGVGDGWSMVNVPVEKLVAFRAAVINAGEAAYQDTVEYKPGPHCWKCPGRRGLCPAVLSDAVNCIVQTPPKDAFAPVDAAVKTANLNNENPREARRIAVDQVMTKVFGGVLPWPLLDTLDNVRAFIKELDRYSYTWLKSGKTIPGWGLETVDGRRTWSHPEEVPGALSEILGGKPEDYNRVTSTPITLTEAERLARKAGKKIDGLIKKPVTQKRVRREDGETNPMGFTKVK